MSTEKIAIFGEPARGKMAQGIHTVARAVGATYGPYGHNVLLPVEWAPPTLTLDGVTVAKAMDLKDALQDQGAQLVKYAAMSTHKAAGDGTTTTILLADGLVREGMKALASGIHPVPLTEQLSEALEIAVAALQDLVLEATKERLSRVASIAARDRKIGELIVEALDLAGSDGEVLLEPSNRQEHTLRTTLDHSFTTAGYHNGLGPHDPKAAYADFGLLVGDRFEDPRDLQRILVSAGSPPLLLVGRISEETRSFLTKYRNSERPVVAAFPPGKGMGHGDALKGFISDLALLAGTDPYTKRTSTSTSVGRISEVFIWNSTISFSGVSGAMDTITAQVKRLRASLERASSEHEKTTLRRRLSFLARPLVTLGVGGATPSEVDELTYRFEDGLLAVRNTRSRGVLPGGGTALLAASASLEDTTGGRVLQEAARYPLYRLFENAGLEPQPLIEKLLEAGSGMVWDYDVNVPAKPDEAGVLDSYVAVQATLRHAVDVANAVLLTDSLLVEREVFW